MKAKLLYALLAVVLLATAVGIGVHVLHKDAHASVTYQVYIWWNDNEVETPVENLWIRFQFDGGGWVDSDSQGGGHYKKTRDNAANEWQIRIMDEDWDGVDPDTQIWTPPAAETSVVWEVQPI